MHLVRNVWVQPVLCINHEMPLMACAESVIGFFQTLKKRRQRQKRCTALPCQWVRTHMLWPYGVYKTQTMLCLEQRWSCDVRQGIVIPAIPASLLCFAAKRPHGRQCRVSSQSAVCSFVFMKVWFLIVKLWPLLSFTNFFSMNVKLILPWRMLM